MPAIEIAMLNASAIETGEMGIGVLIVSRDPKDYESLQGVLRGAKWKLYRASDCPEAARQLQRRRDIAIIVCDREFWRELLVETVGKRESPVLIVAAANADERLWAEALNLGAYDVLTKPFESSEVVRSLSLGWSYRRRESKRRHLMPATESAAS